MKLSEVKELLPLLHNLVFEVEGGEIVPEHFHVTEVGAVTRRFIDCGGTLRHESLVNFQLWDANDYEHRLKPGKLLNIITLCEEKLGLEDGEVEVEYQSGTIGRYRLAFNGNHFILQPTTTACLAQDACGAPNQKQKVSLQSLTGTSCTPGSGCC